MKYNQLLFPIKFVLHLQSINNQKKFGGRGGGGAPTPSAYGTNKKSLGSTRRGLNSKFVPPVINRDEEEAER